MVSELSIQLNKQIGKYLDACEVCSLIILINYFYDFVYFLKYQNLAVFRIAEREHTAS